MKTVDYNNLMENDEDGLKDKFLTFLINNESYGIEIKYVTEIIGIQKITGIPEMPQYVKGVINLRGSVIPVMDLRLRFRMEEKEYNDRTCIIVVHFDETKFGIIVDFVSEVMDITPDMIESSTKGFSSGKNKYIKGIAKVGDCVKIIINIDVLFKLEELEAIFESI